MNSYRRKSLVVLAVLLAILLFYVLTIRKGHAWGDDFAMYILQAKNIAEGKPFAETGYIYNPFNPDLGPEIYPPVFPLLLAPVYGVFGLNLTAFKTEVILIFLAFLFMLFMLFRNDLSHFSMLILILVIGFNPCFWNYKDEILSDIPFLFFVYLSLFFIDQADRQNRSKTAPILWSLLITASICLSVGTRIIGIALIPCPFIIELIRHKKISRFAMILALPFIVLVLALFATNFRFASSYLEQFAFVPAESLRNGLAYLKILASLWNNEHSTIFRNLFYMVFVGLAGIGYLWKAKSKVTSFEVFPLVYFICLIIWPAYISFRGMMPIVPFLVYYSISGIKIINSSSKNLYSRSALVLFVIFIFFSYLGFYSKTDFRPFQEGPEKRESTELFSFIKENTQREDIFIFRKPRVLALFTGRRASVYHEYVNDETLWDYSSSLKASYIIVGRPFAMDQSFLRPFLARNQDKVHSVYANSDFEVFRIANNP